MRERQRKELPWAASGIERRFRARRPGTFFLRLLLASLLLVSPVALGSVALAAAAGGHGGSDAEVEPDKGHGSGHHGPVLDNWFSISFGPDKAKQNGPLGFAILNFVILVWLVNRFARKPVQHYLAQRHSTIKKALSEAASMRDQARRKLCEIETKLRDVDSEIAALKESVLRDAQLEKERILKAAEVEAEAIVRRADKTLEQELRRVRRMLETEAIEGATRAAGKLIAQSVNEADRRRLNEEYFSLLAADRTINGGSN